MIDLAALGLRRDDGGIWRPPAVHRHALSYPSDGHEVYFALEDDSYWFAHRNACIAAALRREGVAGPLLDIGGGNGAVSRALERSAIETVLLEPGEDGARNARRRGVQNVVCATLQDAGFAPASFAAAGLFDVVEHVADDVALLRDVHRILRPGGALCVTTPAFQWLWSDEDEVAGHHRRYTLAGLVDALSRAGFAVHVQTYFFAALTLPLFALRTLPHRLHLRSTRSASDDHVVSPTVRRAIDALLAPEVRRIADGRRIPVGTSCLVVAMRESSHRRRTRL